MEDQWEIPSITVGRLIQRRLRNAVSRFTKRSGSAPEPIRSPAVNAGQVWKGISKPDAIAELCVPTGDDQLDYIHLVLIDLIQKGFVQAVRRDDDPELRFLATPSGHGFLQEYLDNLVSGFLEAIHRDN